MLYQLSYIWSLTGSRSSVSSIYTHYMKRMTWCVYDKDRFHFYSLSAVHSYDLYHIHNISKWIGYIYRLLCLQPLQILQGLPVFDNLVVINYSSLKNYTFSWGGSRILWRGVRVGVRRFPERYFWAKVNVQIGIFHTNEWAKGGFNWTPKAPLDPPQLQTNTKCIISVTSWACVFFFSIWYNNVHLP